MSISTAASREAPATRRRPKSGPHRLSTAPDQFEATAGGPVRVAEFFAGIGLMAEALESRGYEIAWANDIERAKRDLYVANRENAADAFVLGDVRDVTGASLPSDIDLATASFPCTDLSLAGKREGLGGSESSMFWEFARVLDEIEPDRRPRVALLENVHGFATSHDGADLRSALLEMNRLGYSCDVFAINAKHFVPQSRPRMFVVGVRGKLPDNASEGEPPISGTRPAWVQRIYSKNSDLTLHFTSLAELPIGPDTITAIVEKVPHTDERWWDESRTRLFVDSLSPKQSARLVALKSGETPSHRTAYRRTRNGSATWEIRADSIAGCLRTTGGGSSKQALVEAGADEVRVRWMTPLEYARLMGAGSFKTNARSDNQALFGFGDAVVVDVIQWIADEYLSKALSSRSC
ncbi:DNA cytosine methyltransferase [soil metagenome]